MITPVNGHLLVEPIKHEAFMASQMETYQEIGTVVATPKDWEIFQTQPLKVGDKVYFDAWLAAKYPKNDEESYWLVKWEDVRAVEYAESQ